jgi:hypothetical protein
MDLKVIQQSSLSETHKQPFRERVTSNPHLIRLGKASDHTPICGQQSFPYRSPITLAAFFGLAEQPVGDAYPEG